jgi:hypothetical protein
VFGTREACSGASRLMLGGPAWEVAILICCCPPRDRLRRSRPAGQVLAPATGQWRGLAPSGGVLGTSRRLFTGETFRWFHGVFSEQTGKPLCYADLDTANAPSGSDLVPQLVRALGEQRGAQGVEDGVEELAVTGGGDRRWVAMQQRFAPDFGSSVADGLRSRHRSGVQRGNLAGGDR